LRSTYIACRRFRARTLTLQSSRELVVNVKASGCGEQRAADAYRKTDALAIVFRLSRWSAATREIALTFRREVAASGCGCFTLSSNKGWRSHNGTRGQNSAPETGGCRICQWRYSQVLLNLVESEATGGAI
jgi:hypothetical protein